MGLYKYSYFIVIVLTIGCSNFKTAILEQVKLDEGTCSDKLSVYAEAYVSDDASNKYFCFTANEKKVFPIRISLYNCTNNEYGIDQNKIYISGRIANKLNDNTQLKEGYGYSVFWTLLFLDAGLFASLANTTNYNVEMQNYYESIKFKGGRLSSNGSMDGVLFFGFDGSNWCDESSALNLRILNIATKEYSDNIVKLICK